MLIQKPLFDQPMPKGVTARWEFLRQMDARAPWQDLCAIIQPKYPTTGKGRQPYPIEPMVRLWLLSEWFQLTDRAVIDLVQDSRAAAAFTRFDWIKRPPGLSTVQRFRALLERECLDSRLWALLTQHVPQYQTGSIVEPKFRW